MSKPRVTIKDLAKELKISTSTVSRALCDKWDVNPETRKAVLELAEKWNYKPNPISLSLKQSQSMFIGVIVPEFINSFFSEVIMGIQSVLNPEGYHVLIMQSNESHENELRNMKALEAQMVDGFLISVTQESENTSYFSDLIWNNFPVVFFNRICAASLRRQKAETRSTSQDKAIMPSARVLTSCQAYWFRARISGAPIPPAPARPRAEASRILTSNR